jgi:hypothetical protein
VTKTCKHNWIRYVLDDSETSHAQRDDVDDRGRPYRDLPMLPAEAFAYATTIGSDFQKRVVEMICRSCGATLTDDGPPLIFFSTAKGSAKERA